MKNRCKKINREGHEFHSCRFRLREMTRLPAAKVSLEAFTTLFSSRNLFPYVLTWHHRNLFPVEVYARLFLKTLFHYRREGRYLLHGFVLMPDHVHLLLTPAQDVTVERAVQLIKGGYSHAIGTLIGRKSEIWQRGFTDHRIRDIQDFAHHQNYVHQNPVVARLVSNPSEYRYCSAFPGFKLDPWSPAAKAAVIGDASTRTSGTRVLPGLQ